MKIENQNEISRKIREIRKKNFKELFQLELLLAFIFTLVLGIAFLNISHTSDSILPLLVSILFLALFSYFILYTFINLILPPRKKILYLDSIKKNFLCFLDKRGKKYTYFLINNNNYKENNYYYVYKTLGIIYVVLDDPIENIIFTKTREKNSYWLTFYSPIGNIEGIALIPVLYLIGIIATVLLIEGSFKIVNLYIMLALDLLLIIYDLVYKIKIKKSNNGRIDNTRLNKISSKIMYIIMVSPLIIFIIFFIIFLISIFK